MYWRLHVSLSAGAQPFCPFSVNACVHVSSCVITSGKQCRHVQVEDDAAASTAQQQAQLLQETHTTVTAAMEQVAAHGKNCCS